MTTRRRFLQMFAATPVVAIGLKLDDAVAAIDTLTAESVTNYVERELVKPAGLTNVFELKDVVSCEVSDTVKLREVGLPWEPTRIFVPGTRTLSAFIVFKDDVRLPLGEEVSLSFCLRPGKNVVLTGFVQLGTDFVYVCGDRSRTTRVDLLITEEPIYTQVQS